MFDNKKAIEELHFRKIDLVLLDLNLPDAFGIDVCKSILELKPGLPLIFLTSEDSESIIAEAFDAGAVDFIRKPFSSLELKSRIKLHLDLSIMKDELKNENFELNQTREELYISNRRLRSFIDNNSLGIIEMDPDTRILRCNYAAEKIFGYKEEELVGKLLLDIIVTENTRNKFIASLMEVSTTPRYINSLNGNKRKDGQIIICEWNHTLILDSTGEKIGFISLVQDVTENVKMKESMEKGFLTLNMLMDTSPDAILSLDPDEHILSTNSIACDLFGYSEEELVGIFFDKLLTKESSILYHEKMEEYFKNQTFSGSNILSLYGQKKSGKTFPFRFIIKEIKYNEFEKLFIVLIQDETEKKKQEEKIQEIEHKYEEDLKRSYIRFSMVERTAQIGVWEWNSNEGKVFWSEGTERIFGLQPGSFSGTLEEYLSYVYVDDKKKLLKTIDDSIKNKTDYLIEHRIIRKDGKLRWVSCKGNLVTPGIGNYTFMLGIIYDITERKNTEIALQESEALKGAVYNTIKVGVCLTDENGIFFQVNRAYCELYGYSEEELLGESFLKIVPEENRYNTWLLYNDFLSGKPEMPAEWKVLHKDGRLIDVFVTASIYETEDKKRYKVTSVLDISDRVKAEEILKKAKETAELANRAKSEFLANMSHEIRTPMNSILGFTEVLGSRLKDQDLLPYLKNISSSGKTLLTLINDILDLSKVESGKLELHPSPVSLRNIIQEIENIFKDKFIAKGIIFESDISPELPESIYLDEVRIRQILLNLIGNAYKFTHKGRVMLQVEILENKAVSDFFSLRISVIDTGIGIPIEEQTNIFEDFSQVKGTSLKYGGTGLGLAISNKLVKMMKGVIELESVPGEGSSFHVVLHEVKKSMTLLLERQDIETDNIYFDPFRILLVDDISSNRELIKSYLEEQDVSIMEAANGKEALKTLENYNPDIIILDLVMPEMSGYELAHLLRKSPEWNQRPIIGITASVMNLSERKKNQMFNSILFKPISKAIFLQELQKYLPYKESKENLMVLYDTPTLRAMNSRDDLYRELERIKRENWENLSKVLYLDEIQSFIRELSLLLNKNSCSMLENYVKALEQGLESFNMEKIRSGIAAYPAFLEQILEEFKKTENKEDL